ncbi:glycosyl hydrolase family 8 [Desulfosoma sp.]|uniref:glycosyl hydrolase family 8 n=1 Tax=Desulfosoma sp. TaxID=2603217 RepID=UPI00404A008E
MVLLIVLAAFWAGSVVDGRALDRGLWDAYKDRFVSPDGRIIDRGNRQMSHSEGQGYGLILAVSADDRPTFERIRQWTRENLQVRGSDHLLAWAWGAATQWRVDRGGSEQCHGRRPAGPLRSSESF